jgi:hypothetical protein
MSRAAPFRNGYTTVPMAATRRSLPRLWYGLYGNGPLEAPRGPFEPDLEFPELGTSEPLAIVSVTGESVLRRGGH